MKYIRNIIGQVLLSLGSICILVPLCSLMQSDFRWRSTVVALIIGAVLMFGGVVLLKPPKLRTRPLYWAPAVSGVVFGACTVLFLVGGLFVARLPEDRIPDWLLDLMILVLAAGILAAIVGVTTGIRALVIASRGQNARSVAARPVAVVPGLAEGQIRPEGSNRLQSEELREVRRHLTEAERQSLARLMRRFGLWMLFLAGIGSSTAALHGTLGIIFVSAWTVVFLGSLLLGMSALSKFYCATVWGREHGYSHKSFRFFAWPSGKKSGYPEKMRGRE